MRALTRMRSLAAACALLLVVAGNAAAGAPTKPIDRPDSPPTTPTEVGEPDTGHDMPAFIVVVWGRVFFWKLPWMIQSNGGIRPGLRVVRRWP